MNFPKPKLGFRSWEQLERALLDWWARVRLPGDVWDDQLGDIAAGVGGSGTRFEQIASGSDHKTWFLSGGSPGALDVLYWRFQFSHKWDRDEVRPHIHLIPSAEDWTEEKAVVLKGEADWLIPGGNKLGSMSTSFDRAITLKPEWNQTHIIAPLLRLPAPKNAPASTFLLLRVERDGSDDRDTFDEDKEVGTNALNLGVLGADVHRREDRFGTLEEY